MKRDHPPLATRSILLHSVRVCPMQAEMALSAHTSPNQLLEHMIPSQLLDNEVFLGCKRRVASCSLSPVFKHPPNQQGREASATRKKRPSFEGRDPGLHKTVNHRFQTRPSTTRRRDLNYNQCVSAQQAGIACLVSYGGLATQW